jgi:hypothetical protein
VTLGLFGLPHLSVYFDTGYNDGIRSLRLEFSRAWEYWTSNEVLKRLLEVFSHVIYRRNLQQIAIIIPDHDGPREMQTDAWRSLDSYFSRSKDYHPRLRRVDICIQRKMFNFIPNVSKDVSAISRSMPFLRSCGLLKVHMYKQDSDVRAILVGHTPYTSYFARYSKLRSLET